MSGKGVGGAEYDDILQAIQNHPNELPEIMVCSQESLRVLEKQFDTKTRLSTIGHGYGRTFLHMSVWIDNRFDQPMLLLGLDNE